MTDQWTLLKIASYETITDDNFGCRVFWNSGQSVELSSSFETAGIDIVAERQTIVYDDSQGLDWFFRSKYGILIQFQIDVISQFGNNPINWNFVGFAFIPLSPNKSTAILYIAI